MIMADHDLTGRMITLREHAWTHGRTNAVIDARRNRFRQHSPCDTPRIMDMQHFSSMVV